ncbi:hypothetical protein INT48_006434 [Thamnidium elegans]|uniref:BAG domain-containing protein n=1 Tax=Thamnidium elegans TaxID=101142 RepID=A0A8H7SG41_9FUNG|nr:hypothetical protein INT48_006434 [Thamnidium elegans]
MIIVNDKTLTLDDFIQLQALLNYEHAERDRHIRECQSNKEPIIYIQPATPPRYVQFRRDINPQASLQSSLERARLAEALMRLKWLKDQYRRQRALEVQLYLENYRRQALIRSVLEEEEERYYRQCIAAAVEKARIQLCLQRYLDNKQQQQQQQQEWDEQPTEAYQQPIEGYRQPVEGYRQNDEGYDTSRTERLENLLQYIFDHQNLKEVGYEKEVPTEEEQTKNMAQVWKFLSDQRENEDNDEHMSSDQEYEGEYDDDEDDSEDDDIDEGGYEEEASSPPSLVEQLQNLQQQHQRELKQHQQELKQYEQQKQQQDEQQHLEKLQRKQPEQQQHEQKQEQEQQEQQQEHQLEKKREQQQEKEQEQQQHQEQQKEKEQEQEQRQEQQQQVQQKEKQQEQQPPQEEESNQELQMNEEEAPQETQPEHEPENHNQNQHAIHKKQHKHQQKKKKHKHKKRHQRKKHAASSQEPKETEFPPIQDHVLPLQKLIQRLASEPVLIGEQRTEFSDEPKPSGIWAKEVPAKKSPTKKSPTLVPVSTNTSKTAFLPQHIFTEAEPTPTLENMPNTPLGAQEEEEQEQQGFEHFVNTVAAEQKNEEVPTDPRKVKMYQELEKIADLLSDPESDIVKRWQFILQGGKDGKQRLDFSKQKEGTLLLSASTPFNRQFLGSEDELLRTMLRLDAVDSFGDASIREERKKLVKKCESMLEDLDYYKQSQWEKAMIKNK